MIRAEIRASQQPVVGGLFVAACCGCCRAIRHSYTNCSVEVFDTFAEPVLPFPSKTAGVSVGTLFFSHSLQHPKVQCSDFISAISSSAAQFGWSPDAILLGLTFPSSILATNQGVFRLIVVALREYAFRSCAEKVSGIDPT